MQSQAAHVRNKNKMNWLGPLQVDTKFTKVYMAKSEEPDCINTQQGVFETSRDIKTSKVK